MGKLSIVGVSIGNLEDITFRSLRYIFESEVILAEDTRVFTKLKGLVKQRFEKVLEALEIDAKKHSYIISYREQNHDRVINQILALLAENKTVSLFSDSGMPLVSDPGYNLVEEVIKNGHEIEVIPGPSATISTLILSGLESDRFTFVGFLPRRKSRAMNILNKFIESETTVIIYESPFRIKELIRNIKETYGNEVRMAACNDITKKFEKTLRGNPDEILNQLGEAIPKGEWSLALRF